MSPNRDYYRPVEKGLIWALNHIPYYAEWHRARMIFGFSDRNWPAANADPDWPHPERSMNAVNDGMRAALTNYISEQLGERQDLLAKCVITSYSIHYTKLYDFMIFAPTANWNGGAER